MRMGARVRACGIGAADIVAAQLFERQRLDQRSGPPQPGTVRSAADFGLEAQVVEHHDLAVGGELNVELDAVAAARQRRREGAQSVLGIESGAAAMGNVPACHGRPSLRRRPGQAEAAQLAQS